MLLRRAGTTEVSFVLGEHFGCVVAAWPAHPWPEEASVYQLQKEVEHSDIRWLIIDDLEGWEASPCRMYAPITALMNDLPARGLMAVALGWTNLLRASALQCFGGMGMAQLGLLVSLAWAGSCVLCWHGPVCPVFSGKWAAPGETYCPRASFHVGVCLGFRRAGSLAGRQRVVHVWATIVIQGMPRARKRSQQTPGDSLAVGKLVRGISAATAASVDSARLPRTVGGARL